MNRLLTRKDKNGHRRSKSQEPGKLYAISNSTSSSVRSISAAFPSPDGRRSPHRQVSFDSTHATIANTSSWVVKSLATSNGILAIFKPDSARKSTSSTSSKSNDEFAKQIAIIHQKREDAGLTAVDDAQIEYALQTKFASGDAGKAHEILILFTESVDGHVRPYNSDIYMKGAENRAAVTCYLDSLLFAMFARLGSFEPILYTNFEDEPRRRLATLIRLWVNMLRSGKLIHTDLTKHLQEALAACGWEEAAKLNQQDTSEAFGFITEKLELPLLTLEMDIYHEGTLDDKDDHKFINERLLEVAVPADSDTGKPIRLEDCLEEHFNTRVEVVRRMERRDTLYRSNTHGSVMSAQEHEDGKHEENVHVNAVHLENALVEDASITTSPTEAKDFATEMTLPHLATATETMDATGEEVEHMVVETTEIPETPGDFTPTNPSIVAIQQLKRPVNPTRGSSIIRRRVVSEEEGGVSASGVRMLPKRKESVRKEVLMPAWQFFKIIPWYTTNVPSNDSQVADHFKSSRPVLGICLKRYEMNAQGKPVRRNTPIDIPLQIALPHFIQDDKVSTNDDAAPLFGNFNLVLQSMVCHRGNSLHSGHYISVIRGGSKQRDQMPESGSAELPPEYAEDKWIKFDDLASERVSYVDIDKIMTEEMPYLLFYQVQPLFNDDHIPETTGHHPPSYEDTAPSFIVKQATPIPNQPPSIPSTTPFSTCTSQTSYFDNMVAPSDSSSSITKGRISMSDIDRPRKSLTISDSERRGSLAFTDASTASFYTNSTPVTPGDETTPSVAGRLSRAASRFTKGRSRPTSHVDSDRIGGSVFATKLDASFQRLNIMRSREMLNKASESTTSAPTDVNITVTESNGRVSKPASEKSLSDGDGSIVGDAPVVGMPASSTWAPTVPGGLGLPSVDRSRSQRKKDKGKMSTWSVGTGGGVEHDSAISDETTLDGSRDKKHHSHHLHHHGSLSKIKGKSKDKEGKEGEDRECVVM